MLKGYNLLVMGVYLLLLLILMMKGILLREVENLRWRGLLRLQKKVIVLLLLLLMLLLQYFLSILNLLGSDSRRRYYFLLKSHLFRQALLLQRSLRLRRNLMWHILGAKMLNFENFFDRFCYESLFFVRFGIR